MARTKYTFEKRQREIARQKKQQEKTARRAEAKKSPSSTEEGLPETDADLQAPEDHDAPQAT